MNTHFHGLNPSIVLDMNRLGTAALTDMQRMWRDYPDILGLIDDQIDLMHKNVMLKHNASNTLHSVKMGYMNHMAGAVTYAAINRAVADNAAVIRANGRIIFDVITAHMTGRVAEA